MNSSKEKIDLTRLPRHVAVIMDGNRRWAKIHGEDAFAGHKKGVSTVREITEASAELGIDYLTLYAFSTENWNRAQNEVDFLMELLVNTIEQETETLHKNNVRILTIGNLQRLSAETRAKIEQSIQLTARNTKLNLVIAFNYSSRMEITDAVKKIAQDVSDQKLNINNISEDIFSGYLTTKSIPDPDLLIRTSNELRLSNFLLWQAAYTELYFTDTLWPDFSAENYYDAIYEFQQRNRRFGK